MQSRILRVALYHLDVEKSADKPYAVFMNRLLDPSTKGPAHVDVED
jgi:hypothetical protein